MTNRDPAGILMPDGSRRVKQYVVTYQAHVRIDGFDPTVAESVVLGGISISGRLLPFVLGQGAIAQEATPELLKSLGFEVVDAGTSGGQQQNRGSNQDS